jgi:TolB-like protein/Tfp pilus assembly protein PilF
VLSLLGRGEEVAEPSSIRDLATLDDDRPTIAVLPLTNLSANEENAYFAAGIHEELLRLLSLVRSLGVISRTSVLRYAGTDRSTPEIAAELGARYIVEGSVQEDRGRVRIHVQLIDAPADQHLWAERYDGSLDDIFALQSDVAEAIAGEVQAVVTPQERARIEAQPTQDPVAYDLYLRAVELNSSIREEYDTRIELLRRATRLDPDFAVAHAALAGVFGAGQLQHGYPPLDSGFARADRALALDPNLASAHASKGWLLTFRDQFEAGRASLQRAITLNPNLEIAWSGLALNGLRTGDLVGGALAARRSLQADRYHWGAALFLGNCFMVAGMHDEAARWYDEGWEVFPSMWFLSALMSNAVSAGDRPAAQEYAARMQEDFADNPMALYSAAAFYYLAVGNLEAAETALRPAVSSLPELNLYGSPTAQALLGWVQAQSGRPEGRERLERLREVRMEQVEQDAASLAYHNDMMLIASVLGDEDEQLRWFLATTRLDAGGMWYLARNGPWFDRIRHRPEFQAGLREWEEELATQRRELAALGPWMPEVVLGGEGG